MKRIEGKSIIVTGGGSGIGEAAAGLFARNGANVTIADVNATAGQRVTGDIQARGHSVQFVQTDIASESDVVRMVESAVERYGRLDGALQQRGHPGRLLGLTRAAAAEYGEHQIRVNAIAPTGTRTPMYLEYLEANPAFEEQVKATHPLRRASEPSEQAEAAMWLLSDAASFVTGVVVPVDGGYTIL